MLSPLRSHRRIWSARAPELLFALKNALAAEVFWELTVAWLRPEAAALALVSAVIMGAGDQLANTAQAGCWATVECHARRTGYEYATSNLPTHMVAFC